jgi:hypothetical protein
MPTTTAQEVKRVSHSEELLHPGDYAFVGKREPIVITHQEPATPPQGLFRRLWWRWFFGEKMVTSKTLIPQWPDIDTVIVNCPLCNGPVATTKNHTIACLDPITIETPITCPYCRTFTFKVVEGKIMLA